MADETRDSGPAPEPIAPYPRPGTPSDDPAGADQESFPDRPGNEEADGEEKDLARQHRPI